MLAGGSGLVVLYEGGGCLGELFPSLLCGIGGGAEGMAKCYLEGNWIL